MKIRNLFTLLIIGILFCPGWSFAQITLTPTDTTICPNQTYTIHASFASAYSPNNTDDEFSNDTVNLGFPFVFYGDTFSRCIVSANNFITFDLSKAGQYSNWQYPFAESGGELNNVIMFPFQDVDFSTATLNPNPGKISYQTFGSAPNRKFVLEFCSVPLYGCSTMLVTDELILYEGTNVIEMHITQKPSGCSWNGGTGIEGLRYNSLQDLVPGRNVVNVNWGATNDARRFTPNGTTAYTIDTIPFAPVPILQNADSSQINWYEEGNPVSIGTGSSVTVTVDANVHYYVAQITGQACNDTADFTYSDTSWVHNGTQFDTLNVNICQGDSYNFYGRILNYSGTFDTAFTNTGGCDSFIRVNLYVNPLPIMALTDTNSNQFFCKGASATLAIAQPSTNYSYKWKLNGQVIPGGVNSSINTDDQGDYQLFVTTIKGCTDSSIIVHLKKDSVNIDYTVLPHLGCTDDTIQIVNNSEPGISYLWNFGDGSYPLDTSRDPWHIYAQQATYQVQLIMKDSLGCKDSLTKFINLNHPLAAAFSVDKDSLCQGEGTVVHFTNESTGGISDYQWDFGDADVAGGQITDPNHQYILAGNHAARLIVSDTLGCHDTAIHFIYVDSLPFLYLTANKTNLCTGEQLYLRLNYLAATATQISWSFGDGTHWLGSGKETHSYDQAGTYPVTVSVDYSVCPGTNDTLDISVHELPLVYLGNDTVLCLQGDPILLKNLAANQNPLTQYKWNTGDTTQTLKVVHPGLYSLTASLYDCTTTESVKIDKDCYTDVPNAFTPNGDGINDYFFPRQYLSSGVAGFTLTVFDRWGQKVFETNKAEGRGWDGNFNGKPQPQGVYIYQINVIYHNGRTEQYSGNITLIR